MATMRDREHCASTMVWAPVPQPMSSTRVRGPTPGTSPRARRVLAVLPGPCRGSPLNSSKNSAVARSSAISPFLSGLSVASDRRRMEASTIRSSRRPERHRRPRTNDGRAMVWRGSEMLAVEGDARSACFRPLAIQVVHVHAGAGSDLLPASHELAAVRSANSPGMRYQALCHDTSFQTLRRIRRGGQVGTARDQSRAGWTARGGDTRKATSARSRRATPKSRHAHSVDRIRITASGTVWLCTRRHDRRGRGKPPSACRRAAPVAALRELDVDPDTVSLRYERRQPAPAAKARSTVSTPTLAFRWHLRTR